MTPKLAANYPATYD